MFSTILKEVTGYFDRRSLLSAFFPSVIAWATTLFLWIALSRGMSDALAAWEKQGALMTALLILAFLVWCAFWSFLTLNFRAGLTRLFEGHWPFALWLEKRRRNVHKAEYDRRDTDDTDLDDKEFEVQSLRSGLVPILEYAKNPVSLNKDAEATLDRLIRDMKNLVNDWEHLTLEEFQALTVTANQIKENLVSAPSSKPSHAAVWECRKKHLDKLIRQLDQVSPDMKEERQRRVRNFDMYYPPGRHEVMPTKLGNVLSAADLRVGKRYQLDAGLIWSRLQPNLPKEFAESLQDSRMALDMMLTLSAFCLAFGLVQSLMLTYKLPLETLGAAPLILTLLVPLGARKIFQLNKNKTVAVTAATIMALIVIPLVTIGIMLKRGFWSPLVTVGDAGLRIEAFLVFITAYAVFAWIVYANAVHAAVAYGEKVQSAFDLYRWTVFEGLQLQLPSGFADEQQMWKEVCALLSQSKSPDGRYYRYIKSERTKEDPNAPKPTLPLPPWY